MKIVKVYQYDAFSCEPNQGNSADGVLNGDVLTTDEMQAIAYEVQIETNAGTIPVAIKKASGSWKVTMTQNAA